MQNITITRALGELKLIKKRIQDKLGDFKSVDFKQEKFKGQALLNKMPIEEFEKKAVGDYQSIEDLLSNYSKIKAAIGKKNSETIIDFMGNKISITGLLSMKETLPFRLELLKIMKEQKTLCEKEVAKSLEALENSITKMYEANTGKDRRVSSEDYNQIAEPLMKANKLTLVDPLNVAVKIQELDNSIKEFIKEIDVKLTEVNSTITIEI